MKKTASITLLLVACACSRSNPDTPDSTELRQQKARELGLKLILPSDEQIAVAESAERVVNMALHSERPAKFEGVTVATGENCATGLVHRGGKVGGHDGDRVFVVTQGKLQLDGRGQAAVAAATKCIDESTAEISRGQPDL